jgi:TonB-linked outer membrane protein, SusC/RagA family/TonB-dependent outer membrane receptor, SusC/RagA subfamily, signature region
MLAASLSSASAVAAPVLSEASSQALSQQKKSATGVVKDSKGVPIVGADVMVKGTTIGTITDADGKFTLDVPADAVLVINFLGFTAQEVPAGTDLVVVLQDDSQFLNEVVFVGYGTQKKVNLTGAVDVVTSEVLDNRPVSNLTQGLQGAIPNLQITFADGKPNRSSSYQVRGTGSIGQGGSALVLIDGVEGDPAMLNPNDVASVSVLKDASSAAIYGARGTYGVILITTKDPNKEKTSVTYSANFLMKSPTITPDVVTDGLEFTEIYLQAYQGWQYSKPSKFHSSLKITDAWLQNLRDGASGVVTESDGKYSYYGSTDWFGLLYQDHSFGQEHNINVQGGGAKANFMVSGRYYTQDGIFNYDPDKYNMFNIRTKGSVQVFDWLKITDNAEFSQMKYHNPMNAGEGSVWYAIESEGQPVNVMFNPDGSLTQAGATIMGSYYYKNNYQDSMTRVFRNTAGFTANVLKDILTLNGDFTLRYTDDGLNGVMSPIPYKKAVDGAASYMGSSFDGIYNSDSSKRYLAANIYGQYSQIFGKHDVKLMAGYNYEQQIYDYDFMYRNGKIFDQADNIALTTGTPLINTDYNKWRIAGCFFRANYVFADRYLFEVNGRYDGSSKFPTIQQWKFFPSASFGWRVSQEPFWTIRPEAVSNFKLRASYGSLGNGNIAPYKFQELFSIYTQQRLLNGSKNLATSSPAPIPSGLTWETSTTANVGVDLGFLNDRLTFNGDYYIRKTTDMYVPGTPLPAVYGASAPKGNYADMTTKGWEFTIVWKDQANLAGKPFNYEIKGTLADSKSVIDSYPNDELYVGSDTYYVTSHNYYKGMTLGEIWGFENDGYFTAADFDASGKQIAGPDQSFIMNNAQNKWEPGDIKFKDLDGDGKIDFGTSKIGDMGDRKIIGNRLPRYTYSLNLNLDWNGIFMSAFFQGVGKQDWWAGGDNSMFWGQYSRPYSNIPADMVGNWWTEDNPDAYWPKYRGYIAHQGNRTLHLAQSKYLQNVAYIRLKNLQVGYTLPKKWLESTPVSAARVYVSAENLWCWSPLYKHSRQFDVNSINGEDPETLSLISAGLYSSPIMGDGGSNYSYPIMKTVTLGLSVTF